MEERSVINKSMSLTREENNDFHKAKNINLLSQFPYYTTHISLKGRKKEGQGNVKSNQNFFHF